MEQNNLKKENKIYKIVVTGGPCAGKTACLTVAKKHLEDKGYLPLIVPETATELIMCGISPANTYVNDFQSALFTLQIQKEDSYTAGAESITDPKDIVLFLDRGAIDGMAYMQKEAYTKMIESHGYSIEELYNRYPHVIYLQSVAMLDSSSAYGTDSNPARFESVKNASMVCRKTKEAWSGYQNLIEIPATEHFEDKLQAFLDCIDQILQNK